MRYIFLSLIFMISLGLNAQTPQTPAKEKKCPNKEQTCKKDCSKMDKSKCDSLHKAGASCCKDKKNCKKDCKKVDKKQTPQTGSTEKCPGQKKDCKSTCPHASGAKN